MRANESGPERESRGPHVVEPQPGGDPTPSREPFRSRLRKGVLAAAAVGGVLGGSARYVLGLTFPTPRGTFPLTTFAINVSGAFLLALLLVYVLEIWPPTRYVRPFAGVGFLGARHGLSDQAVHIAGVGFCGACTTFSTFRSEGPSVRRFEPRGGSVGGRGGARHRIVPRKDRPSRQGLDTWIYETSP
ncbi:CrcB family protein [Streptomyces sp. NPDC059441]|uniref:FluC/FEX family fluoride channel n=1 Tax=Streptomyces sp. NPDC059441 TaxID=3346829 RepID=UPI00367D2EDD